MTSDKPQIPDELQSYYQDAKGPRAGWYPIAPETAIAWIERIATLTAERDALASAVAEACRVMNLRKAADDAWRDGTVRHDICHEMTLVTQEAAEKFLEEYL